MTNWQDVIIALAVSGACIVIINRIAQAVEAWRKP